MHGPPADSSVVVDGETFEMRARPGEPGTYDVTRVTGPPGRGFTVGRLGSAPLSRAELEADARAFLAMQDDDE